MSNKSYSLLLSLLVFLFTINVNAATYTVTKTADTNDSVCDADCSLREAVAIANATADDDIIAFSSIIFSGTKTITLGGTELSITNNGTLTINGTGANKLGVSANNLSRVFNVNTGANLTINGLTVRDGRQSFGGGIYAVGNLTLLNSSVSYNTAATCGICNNATGAGIVAGNNSLVVIANSTISNNSAQGIGGGIFNSSTSGLNITNSTLSNNNAPIGGGIFNNNPSTMNLKNSTVSGNFVTNSSGGVITNNGATPVTAIQNSIIAGNIVASNGSELQGNFISLGYNLIGNTNNTTITGDTTGNIINVDARLAPLGYYGGTTMTHALLSGSPAIDAGNTATSPATDQRGATRIGTADIGAFELNNLINGGSYQAVLPSGKTNLSYSFTLISNSGSFTYSLTGGSLPNGLSLSSNFSPNAVISLTGVPTQTGVFNFTITGTDGVNSVATGYTLNILAPTAAPTSISGQVFTRTGRGLANAFVIMTNQNGESVRIRTNQFGYYRFANVSSGETYIFNVASKSFQFTPQTITVVEDFNGLNFTPQ
jgi:CSLREA domain-containing protein